jgi:excisionase family DNA binding protein
MTGLSRSTVYSLLQRGLLRSIKVPGCRRVLIEADDLRLFLEGGKSRGAEPLGTAR